MKEYDLIVIGSGPAGEKAAAKAAFYNYKVAIVEKDEMYGGAGTQTGTIPSKTLKETAIYLSGIREQGVYGVERILEHTADIKDFYYRKDVVKKLSSDEIEKNMMLHSVDIYRGEGRFKDAHTIMVSGNDSVEIKGKFILIATGSTPFHIPGIPFDGLHVHDSDSILNLPHIPKSLVIVGAGVIGCEYATMFAVMGCEVTLVNSRDDFLTFLDNEIVALLRQYMEDAGIRIITGNRVEGVSIGKHEDAEIVSAHLSNGEPISAEMFLYAAGRCGNTDNLNLQAAGLEAGERGLLNVDEEYRTNVEHIFAAGDVIGFPALASTSMDQGRVAVAKMFKLDDLRQIDKQFPYGVYTIPEVSCVGMTEEECQKREILYGIGKADFQDMARGRIMGFTKGCLKIIYEKGTDVILGVHVVGVNASELIHFGMLLVEEKLTIERIISMVFNFPTLHELYKYAAYDALSRRHPLGKSEK